MDKKPLEGLMVVLSGEVPGLSRPEAADAVVTLGGTLAPGVSKKVGLLIAGEGSGSKTKRAHELSIPVLDAGVFASLVADPSSWDGESLGEVQAAPEAASVVEYEPSAAERLAERRRRTEHLSGQACFSRNGTWTVISRCPCGWGNRSSRLVLAREAEAAHAASPEEPAPNPVPLPVGWGAPRSRWSPGEASRHLA